MLEVELSSESDSDIEAMVSILCSILHLTKHLNYNPSNLSNQNDTLQKTIIGCIENTNEYQHRPITPASNGRISCPPTPTPTPSLISVKNDHRSDSPISRPITPASNGRISCPPTPTPSLISVQNHRVDSPVLNNSQATPSVPPIPPRQRPKALAPIRIPLDISRRRNSSTSDKFNNLNNLNHNGNHSDVSPEKIIIEPIKQNGNSCDNDFKHPIEQTSCCQLGAHPKNPQINQNTNYFPMQPALGNFLLLEYS